MSRACDLLVIGTSVDPHIDAVLRLLPSGLRVARFDVDRFPLESFVTLGSDHDPTPIQLSSSPGSPSDLSTARAVWFRRTGMPRIRSEVADAAHRRFALDEAEALLLGVSHLLAGACWVSPFDASRRASSKLLQLDMARQSGLTVPDTLVTNDPARASAFLAAHPRVVYKTLAFPTLRYADRRTIVFSHLVTERDHQLLPSVACAPCLFQEYVEKAYELRITVAGSDFHCVRINSQASAQGKIDWRASPVADLSYEGARLPEGVEGALRNLLDRLGLRFGAIDMIVTPEGRYVFLEVNPHGAWLWLETIIGCPIAASLARLLATAARGAESAAPFAHPAAPGPRELRVARP